MLFFFALHQLLSHLYSMFLLVSGVLGISLKVFFVPKLQNVLRKPSLPHRETLNLKTAMINSNNTVEPSFPLVLAHPI